MTHQMNGGGMKMKTTTLDNRLGHRDDKEMGRMKGKLALNFISKRRVPNGPDPIHNRRAGNSHQPPGRA
ncbi:hypothetical protein Leryth_002253 [Lithospermum erythrorhizon]|nr:hypothetical protein Leryth_002253 [Lithospermum erythrorhizon]